MAAPVFGNTNSVFSFTAQKSEPENKPSTTNASVFNNFGNSTAQSVTPSTGPALNFGGTTMNSTTFGSSAGNNFGGNAPSVIPTFGSTPSVFGTKDSAPVTTAAPVFGGKTESVTENACQPECVSSLSLVSVVSHPLSLIDKSASILNLEVSVQEPSANKLTWSSSSANEPLINIDQGSNKTTLTQVYIDAKGSTPDTDQPFIIDNRDVGLQTEFKTVILKDQCVQTVGPYFVLSPDTSQCPDSKETVHIPAFSSIIEAYEANHSPAISLNCMSSVFHSRSVFCINEPLYCVAKGSGYLLLVSSTETRCNICSDRSRESSRRTLITIGHRESSGKTSDIPLVKKSVTKTEALSISAVSNHSPISCKMMERCERLSVVGEGLSCSTPLCNQTTDLFVARSTGIIFGRMEFNDKLKASFSQLPSIGPETVDSGKNKSSCLTSSPTHPVKQDDCQMDIEASPIVKLLTTQQPWTYQAGQSNVRPLAEANQAGPSGVSGKNQFNWYPGSLFDISSCSFSFGTQPGKVDTIVHKNHFYKTCSKKSTTRGPFEMNDAQNFKPQLKPELFYTSEEVDDTRLHNRKVQTNANNTLDIQDSNISPRKVSFAFSPPVDIMNSKVTRSLTSVENDTNKSILKKKTKEMVSAFYSTSILESETDAHHKDCMQGSSNVPPTASPSSTSLLFGGEKTFCNTTQAIVGDYRNNVSLPTFAQSGSSTGGFLPRYSVFTEKKDSVYFTVGKSSKERNCSNIFSRLKHSKQLKLASEESKSSRSVQSTDILTRSVNNPTLVVPPTFTFTDLSRNENDDQGMNDQNVNISIGESFLPETTSQDSGVFVFTGSATSEPNTISTFTSPRSTVSSKSSSSTTLSGSDTSISSNGSSSSSDSDTTSSSSSSSSASSSGHSGIEDENSSKMDCCSSDVERPATQNGQPPPRTSSDQGNHSQNSCGSSESTESCSIQKSDPFSFLSSSLAPSCSEGTSFYLFL